jgi:alpha-tubulin suppressor-like RCC1 family protein
LLTLTSSDPDGIICAGESITFQASGASQFQFFVDGASTGAFDVNNSLDSTFTNGQTVAVQGLLGNCSAWADTVFTIDVRPTITWSFSANEICANDTILLEADGDTVYQYHIDGTPVTALQYDSVYHATGLTDGQIITVTGTTGACTPSQLLVTVHPVPLVDVVCSDPDTAICQGDNIAFTASGSEQYAFFVNGSIVGPYTTVPTFSSTGINNGDVVTMQSNTSFGCHSFSADTFTVEVAPYPVVSMTQTDLDQIICNGDSVVFNASGANLYEFFITGTSQGAASITDSLVAGALSNGDVVTVRGTTGYCSATSTDVYNFTVNAIPNISFTPLSGLLFCNGDTVKLLAGGATSYQFYVDGSPYGSVTGNSVFSSSTLITGQTVSVDGYLLGCVGSSDTAYTLTVNNYPVLVFNNNQPTGIICYGDTVVFEGLGAQTYSFYLDGMPISNDSVYSIANLQNGQAVTLFGANGVCGLWADSTMVIQVNYVDVELTTDAIASSICSGTQVEFTASGADEYEFFIDGVSTGAPSASNVYQSSTLTNGQIVSVEGTSTTLGCSQQAFSDFYIHVLDVPTVSVSPSNHFCEGDSAMLSSSVATGNLWYLDGSVLAGESNPSFWVYDQGTYTTSSTSGAANRVLSCGDNSEGQFGDGTTLNSPAMMQSLLSVDAANLSCGEQFTLVLCADGSVRAWGRNEFGALGNGNYSDSEVPVQVGSINNAIKVVAGNRFGLALLADSTVVAWGENTFGQLGYGNYSTSNFPFAVVGLDSVIDIAAGENHAIALTANGKVWAWGRNQAGQLGDSTLVTRNAPVVVKNISNVVAVGCGANHSMALKSDGSLHTWGSNSSGQLGTGNLISALTPTKVHFFNKISSFDGGFAHSLACDTAGFLYSWGSNTFGQLGKAVISESLFPVYPDANGNIKQVKAGKYSSYALRSDSNLLVWGFNTSAQLGLQTTTNVFTPEIVDQAFAVAAFDGGGNHLSVIPSATHSCTSLGVVITVDTVPSVNLNVNGLVLSTNTVGVSYQWYYNGSEIPGATGTSISISAWGSYYVVVTFANGCSGFSDEYQYGVGFDEYNNENQLSIYPNPGNGHFFVTISGNENAVSWKIYNMLGSVVASSDNLVPTSVFEVDGFDIQPGVYSIQVISGSNSVLTGRFVVND